MNFRLTVRMGDDEPERTTLREFVADNEAAPIVCERVRALEPGGSITWGAAGPHPMVTVTRASKAEQRFTRIRVPIKFDGAEFATVTIDRKRLTLAIRPARRRSVFELELSDFAQRMLERQAKLNVRARKLARRKTRR